MWWTIGVGGAMVVVLGGIVLLHKVGDTAGRVERAAQRVCDAGEVAKNTSFFQVLKGMAGYYLGKG